MNMQPQYQCIIIDCMSKVHMNEEMLYIFNQFGKQKFFPIKSSSSWSAQLYREGSLV